MQDKYYTPDIEDIRVGYECELRIEGNGYLNNFVPYKFGYDIPKDRILIEDGVTTKFNCWELRTPYLTKEQIEDEGWEKDEIGLHKGDVAVKLYEKLGPRHNKQIIRIWQQIKDGQQLFLGECPSINEFRMLIKLLNIK